MLKYQSPNGKVYNEGNMIFLLARNNIRRDNGAYVPLRDAIGACIENPILLNHEDELLVAAYTASDKTNQEPDQKTLPMCDIKAAIKAGIYHAWCYWLCCKTGQCPPCPIPYTVFIARFIEALDKPCISDRQKLEWIWREYKEG